VGVGIDTTGDLVVDANDIVDNDEYGMVVTDVHRDTVPVESGVKENVDATGNWWGDETGPTHPEKNPGGAGDRVSDNVAFDPWAETRQRPDVA